MSKKNNWAEMDKRVRGRRALWTNEEAKELDDGLKKLPDMANAVDQVTLAQPALGAADAADSN